MSKLDQYMQGRTEGMEFALHQAGVGSRITEYQEHDI